MLFVGVENRFKMAFMELENRGIFPSPSAINRALGRDRRPYHRRLNIINGVESKLRQKLLKGAGYTREYNGRHIYGRWSR